ncbi:MAG: M3 family metallopeptidase, partial [Bdellovibrionales bacterium]|nr:M3 family metallopeptidase [Bdellovibrionales bacterium]
MKLVILVLSLSLTNWAWAASVKPNPLLTPWTGPYQGVPPFDQIKEKHFKPAMEVAMKNALSSYEQIAQQKETPTFENTIVAMEKITIETEKVFVLFFIWSSSLSNSKIQRIEKQMAPKLAQYSDKIVQNGKLFKRIETLYKDRKTKKWSTEQNRLVWHYYNSFVKRGAALSPEQKKKVAAINERQAELTTKFSQNLLKDEETDSLHITDKEGIKGLPQWLVDAAQSAAKKQGKKGWVISNTRSSMEPFITYSPNRSLREKAFKKWTSRGDNDNENNNNKIISEILKLRAERSKIMGFDSYAQWQLSDKMAKNPEKAMNLMMRVWKPAAAQIRKDVSGMQRIVDREKGGLKIEPWDYRYYAEKLRKDRYNFDMDLVKPYMQLQNIEKAMFWMAKKLYSFEFEKITDVPT